MTAKELKYLLLITVVFIAACIETDIYLPAFPDMMTYFAVSEEAIQSILTWNFIGICLSGPLYGPISDSAGRKKPIIAALTLFLAGSIFTLYAHSFELMLWGRLLQGLGSGGCFTLGTAIIFDAFKADKAVNALSYLNSSVPFIMALAPITGGYLNEVYGFRANFLAITLFVVISLIICIFFLDETLPNENRAPLALKKVMGDYKQALTCLPFWQITIAVSLMFAGYITFLSSTAVLFVVEMGVSKQSFPYYQGALLITWLIASLTYSHTISWLGASRVKVMGIGLLIIGGISLLIASLISPQNAALLTIGMLIYTVGCNWTQGLYFPESMELLPDIKGITSSILTSVRLLITALTVALTGALYNATIYPTMGVVVGIIATIVPLLILYERKSSRVGSLVTTSTSSLMH